MKTRILIADDHAVVRIGLRALLEAQNDMSVVGTANNGREAVEKTGLLRPDVVLMDISMPDLNGIEATRLICSQHPSVRVVILSMHYTNEFVFRAMRAGARGYLLKESAGGEVVKAVRTVMRGSRYLGKGVELGRDEDAAEKAGRLKSPLDSLSERERETLQLVAEGKTSAEIALALGLSPKSVETYRSRLMKKLGVKTIPALVKFAVQHGVTSLD
ncbi:MAG TPA: response regulator transcription factor [Nitrospirota bacterium]|nr:response regulator transcription factor [Nitrospirota bacterium]